MNWHNKETNNKIHSIIHEYRQNEISVEISTSNLSINSEQIDLQYKILMLCLVWSIDKNNIFKRCGTVFPIFVPRWPDQSGIVWSIFCKLNTKISTRKFRQECVLYSLNISNKAYFYFIKIINIYIPCNIFLSFKYWCNVLSIILIYIPCNIFLKFKYGCYVLSISFNNMTIQNTLYY